MVSGVDAVVVDNELAPAGTGTAAAVKRTRVVADPSNAAIGMHELVVDNIQQ